MCSVSHWLPYRPDTFLMPILWGWAAPRVSVKFHLEESVNLQPLWLQAELPPRILPWGECEPMATMAAGLHHSWGWAVPRVGVKFHLEGSVKLWPLQLHAYAIAVPGVSVQFHLEGSVKPWPLWLQACATAEAELSPESMSSSTSRGVEAPGHLGCRLVP